MLTPQIMDYYNQLSPIPAEEWARVGGLFVPKSFKRNEFFLRVDEDPLHIGVVKSGLFRFFYIDEDGKEWVKSFETNLGLLAPYAEILQDRPSRTFIQALTDSEILVAPQKEFMAAVNGRLDWEMFLRRVAERFYLKKENREYEFLKLSAKERWMNFLEDFKHIHQEIPDYHIASYLGITPQSLSRLRKTT
jgi:CRP-like cAMP-binding protein